MNIKKIVKDERGEIGSSAMIIIGIFLAAILMFIFPLMSMSERNDDISQLAVKSATNDFANKIKTTGKITLEEYEKYIQTISTTGNSFEAELAVHQLDTNPGVKVTQAEMTKIGENVYWSKYTSQVLEELNKTGSMKLKSGDMVYVTVKNTNKTIAQLLRNFFYQITGDETAVIAARDGGVVAVNGSN